MREAVIVGAVRTALGGFNGTLAPVAATQLGGIVITAALERAGVPKEAVDEVIMGQVLPCGSGQNPAKQAAIQAGMPWEVAGPHGQQGLRLRAQGRDARRPGDPGRRRRRGGGGRHGEHEHGPLLPREGALRLPPGRPGRSSDHMVHDGLWDIVNDFHMGISNDLCSRKIRDQPRGPGPLRGRVLPAAPSRRSGRAIRAEIVPVHGPAAQGRSDGLQPGRVPAARPATRRWPRWRPAFKKEGVDHGRQRLGHQRRGRGGRRHGRGEGARRLGCEVAGAIGAQAIGRARHEVRAGGPHPGHPQGARKRRRRHRHVDLFEINEAFSGSTVAVAARARPRPGEGQRQRRQLSRSGTRSARAAAACWSPCSTR